MGNINNYYMQKMFDRMSSSWGDTPGYSGYGSSVNQSIDKTIDSYLKDDKNFQSKYGNSNYKPHNGVDFAGEIVKQIQQMPNYAQMMGGMLFSNSMNVGAPQASMGNPYQAFYTVNGNGGNGAEVDVTIGSEDEENPSKKSELTEEHKEAKLAELLESGMGEADARALISAAQENAKNSRPIFDDLVKKFAELPSGDLTDEEMKEGTPASRETLKGQREVERAGKLGTVLAEAAGLSKTQAAEFVDDYMLRSVPEKGVALDFVRDASLGGSNRGHRITNANGLEGFSAGDGIFRKKNGNNDVPREGERWYRDAACTQEIEGAHYVTGENGAGKLVFDDVVRGGDDFAKIEDKKEIALIDGVAHDVYEVTGAEGSKAKKIEGRLLLHDSYNDKWYSATRDEDENITGRVELENAPVRTFDGKRLIFDRANRARAEFDVSDFGKSREKVEGFISEFKKGIEEFKKEDGKRAERRVEEFETKWKDEVPENIRASVTLAKEGNSVEFKIFAEEAKAKEVAEWFGEPENAAKVNGILGLLKGSTPIEVKINGEAVSARFLGAAEFAEAAKKPKAEAEVKPEGDKARPEVASQAMGGGEAKVTASDPRIKKTNDGYKATYVVSTVKDGQTEGRRINVFYDNDGKFECWYDAKAKDLSYEEDELPVSILDKDALVKAVAKDDSNVEGGATAGADADVPVDSPQNAAPTETPAAVAADEVQVSTQVENKTMEFAQFDLRRMNEEEATLHVLEKVIAEVKEGGKSDFIDLGEIVINENLTEEEIDNILALVSFHSNVKLENIDLTVVGDYKVAVADTAVVSSDVDSAAASDKKTEAVSWESAGTFISTDADGRAYYAFTSGNNLVYRNTLGILYDRDGERMGFDAEGKFHFHAPADGYPESSQGHVGIIKNNGEGRNGIPDLASHENPSPAKTAETEAIKQEDAAGNSIQVKEEVARPAEIKAEKREVAGSDSAKKSRPLVIEKEIRVDNKDKDWLKSRLTIAVANARRDNADFTSVSVKLKGTPAMTNEELKEVKKSLAGDLEIRPSNVKIDIDKVAFMETGKERTAETKVAKAAEKGNEAKPRSEVRVAKGKPLNFPGTFDASGRDVNRVALRLIKGLQNQAKADGILRPTAVNIEVKGSPDMTETEMGEVRRLVAVNLKIDESKVNIDAKGVQFKLEATESSVAKNKEPAFRSEDEFNAYNRKKQILSETGKETKPARGAKGFLSTITLLKPVGEPRTQGERVGQMYETPEGKEIFAIYSGEGKFMGVKVVGSKTNETHVGAVPENLKMFIPDTIDVPGEEELFAYKEKEVSGVETKPMTEKDGVRLSTETKELHEKRLLSRIRTRVVDAIAEFKKTHGRDAVIGSIDLGQVVITNYGKDDMSDGLARLQWAIRNELRADRDLFRDHPPEIYSVFVLKDRDGKVILRSEKGKVERSTASLDSPDVEAEDTVNFNEAPAGAAQPTGANVQSAPKVDGKVKAGDAGNAGQVKAPAKPQVAPQKKPAVDEKKKAQVAPQEKKEPPAPGEWARPYSVKDARGNKVATIDFGLPAKFESELSVALPEIIKGAKTPEDKLLAIAKWSLNKFDYNKPNSGREALSVGNILSKGHGECTERTSALYAIMNRAQELLSVEKDNINGVKFGFAHLTVGKVFHVCLTAEVGGKKKFYDIGDVRGGIDKSYGKKAVSIGRREYMGILLSNKAGEVMNDLMKNQKFTRDTAGYTLTSGGKEPNAKLVALINDSMMLASENAFVLVEAAAAFNNIAVEFGHFKKNASNFIDSIFGKASHLEESWKRYVNESIRLNNRAKDLPGYEEVKNPHLEKVVDKNVTYLKKNFPGDPIG